MNPVLRDVAISHIPHILYAFTASDEAVSTVSGKTTARCLRQSYSQLLFQTVLWQSIYFKVANFWSKLWDGICNYWWKHLASSHLYLAIGFQYLAEGSKIPIWFASGITYRIPKDGPPSESNIRPITCVNCEYKVYSSILMRWIEKHVTFNSLLQVEQRGSRPGIWGTYENIFIDRVTTRDATQKTKTLCQAWLDITKAYDSTQHR